MRMFLNKAVSFRKQTVGSVMQMLGKRVTGEKWTDSSSTAQYRAVRTNRSYCRGRIKGTRKWSVEK